MSEEDELRVSSAKAIAKAMALREEARQAERQEKERLEASKLGHPDFLPLSNDQRNIAALSLQLKRLEEELFARKNLIEQEQINKNKLISDHQKEVKKLTDQLVASRDEAAKAAKDSLERGEEIARLKDENDALKVQYDAITKYERAAKFWGKKADDHRLGRYVSLGVFIVLGAAFTALGLANFPDIIGSLPKNNAGEIGLSAVVLVSVIALPAIWIMKLLARFVVENFSLTHDAEERRTMMETFLSLIGNPEAKIQGEERLLVLRSVFRPASASQDEGIPVAMLEAAKSIGNSIKSK